MPGIDRGFKIISREAGRALARVAHLGVDSWKPVESTLQTTAERLADRVFRASWKKERFMVYMEFVTTWNKSVPWAILSKSGLIAERERLPVVSLVFILQPRGYSRQNGTMKLMANGRPTQQVWFEEIPLWEIEPAAWWENEPGLMALYPLVHHQFGLEEAIQFASHRIELGEADSVRRADLLTTLGIFGKLANPDIDLAKLIGRAKMKESTFYQEIVNEGIIDKSRSVVLVVIEERFDKRAAAGFKTTVNSIDDVAKLNRLLRLAVRCQNVADFKAALA